MQCRCTRRVNYSHRRSSTRNIRHCSLSCTFQTFRVKVFSAWTMELRACSVYCIVQEQGHMLLTKLTLCIPLFTTTQLAAIDLLSTVLFCLLSLLLCPPYLRGTPRKRVVPPGGVHSILMSMSVHLCITEKPHNWASPIFMHVACGHSLLILWTYVRYFRFCGWRHVFT